MGRRGEEFWGLTYREIDACVEAFLDDQELWNTRCGLIAAMVMNAQRTLEGQKVWVPSDFFQFRGGERVQEPLYSTTNEISLRWANFRAHYRKELRKDAN